VRVALPPEPVEGGVEGGGVSGGVGSCASGRGQGPLGLECNDVRVAKQAIATSHGRSVLTACLLHSDVGEQLRVNDLHSSTDKGHILQQPRGNSNSS
jgi:hypothetical protein